MSATVPFDPSTYSPGAPWTATDFLTRATAAPRIVVADAEIGESTPASFFEPRSPSSSGDRIVTVSANSVDEFEVHLQRSFDDGVTWSTWKAYSGTSVGDTVPYNTLCMLRLTVISGDSPVSLRLTQNL